MCPPWGLPRPLVQYIALLRLPVDCMRGLPAMLQGSGLRSTSAQSVGLWLGGSTLLFYGEG